MKSLGTKSNNLFFIVKLTGIAYLLTAIFLFIFTLAVYKTYMSDKNITIGIIVIYALSNAICGFIAGKVKQSKKFLWGALVSVSYLLVLIVISLIVTKEFMGNSSILLPATLSIIIGGTVGGMIS